MRAGISRRVGDRADKGRDLAAGYGVEEELRLVVHMNYRK